jgi:RNA polymerase sigma factor (sigma-70 family)
MNQQITDYINSNYKELVQITNNITRNHELAGDLLQEVIVQIYDKGDIVLHSYDNDTIKYYIVKIIKINWQSKTSPFHYKIRKPNEKNVQITPDYVNYIPDNQEELIDYEEMVKTVEEEFAELQWFSKRLFELYLTLGSLKKVSKQTNIPIASVGRYIREIKQEIRINVEKRLRNG